MTQKRTMSPASFWSMQAHAQKSQYFPREAPGRSLLLSRMIRLVFSKLLSVTACSGMCGCRHLFFLFALLVVLPLVTAAACSLVFAAYHYLD